MDRSDYLDALKSVSRWQTLAEDAIPSQRAVIEQGLRTTITVFDGSAYQRRLGTLTESPTGLTLTLTGDE